MRMAALVWPVRILRVALRPLLLAILALWFTLLLFAAIPGAEFQQVSRNADAATRAAARAQLGLDQHVLQRAAALTGPYLRGDLGRSWMSGERVQTLIAERLPLTLALLLPGYLLGQLLAIVLAWQRSRLLRVVADTLAVLGLASGVAVLAVLAQLLAQWWPQLPLGGLPLVPWSSYLAHVALPTAVLVLGGFAYSYLHLRALLEHTQQATFALAARARSEPGGAQAAWRRAQLGTICVRMVHVLPLLLLGSVLVETAFAVPGLSTRLVTAILAADQPVILALVLLSGLFYGAVRMVLALLLYRLDRRLLTN
jgi:peptide/nickel transport system permease protein